MKTFAKAPLAVAIAALLAAPYALANDFNTDSDLDVDVDNDITVALTHEVTNAIDVDVDLTVTATDADHFAAATIDRKQFTDDNAVKSELSDNNSTVTGSGNGATGNIGINVASGDLNKQANDTAIASGESDAGGNGPGASSMFWWTPGGGSADDDASMVFAKAATFAIQSSSNNRYYNDGTTNNASLDNSLNNVSGNIGANVAAGAGNVQNNAMTLAVGQGSSAEASTGGVQVSYNNMSDNDLVVESANWWSVELTGNTNTAAMNNSLANASGNVGVNIASGNGNMQSNTLSIARAQ
ncbi:hypothetical protein [Halomonas sp. QHL1]|uniref:hypothetical protein n=1 Tax=Halomonas sp. QHL1 TaxID=1123773 RepID=UPI0008FD335C|nr:hypothetical protein [Halomonas sp. QHL1]OJA05165.1 hypothetical protein QHL1GM_07045 [Halomonas sp. QHL1]